MAGFSTQESLLLVYIGFEGTPVIFFNKSEHHLRFSEEASDFAIPVPESEDCIFAPDLSFCWNARWGGSQKEGG